MTTLIVPLYGYVRNQVKNLRNMDKIARDRKLHVSNVDYIGDNVIAVDVGKRKLIYVQNKPGISSCLLIDLNNIAGCTIKKQYNSINAGDLYRRKVSTFLKSIFLQLIGKNGTGSVALPLYEAENNQRTAQVEQLEAAAEKWKIIVSKLLPVQLRERA